MSTIIPGMRSVAQVERNLAVEEQAPLSPELLAALKEHNWRRAYWFE